MKAWVWLTTIGLFILSSPIVSAQGEYFSKGKGGSAFMLGWSGTRNVRSYGLGFGYTGTGKFEMSVSVAAASSTTTGQGIVVFNPMITLYPGDGSRDSSTFTPVIGFGLTTLLSRWSGSEGASTTKPVGSLGAVRRISLSPKIRLQRSIGLFFQEGANVGSISFTFYFGSSNGSAFAIGPVFSASKEEYAFGATLGFLIPSTKGQPKTHYDPNEWE